MQSTPTMGLTATEPHAILWTLTNAYVPSTCLILAAELGVADAIGDEAIAVDELAARCGLDAGALDRVLGLLAAHGIFERNSGAYAHTAASRLLRSDHPRSMRAFPRMNGLPFVWQAFANLEHSVRTGRPAIETVEPRGFWAYLEDRPDEARIFAQAMTARASGDIAAVLDAYDFRRFGVIADVAGGHGHLIRAVIDATPDARGILVDLPAVIAAADVRHDRVTTCPGDFFADALPAADAYLLMEILHDWDDEQCVAILRAIRAAAAPGATLLVIEDVLAARGTDAEGHSLDVLMLAVTGGRERTPEEFDALFAAAEFGRGRVIETASRLRLVETTAR